MELNNLEELNLALNKLVKNCCLLSFDSHEITTCPIYAEAKHKQVYWVDLWPDSQKDAHKREYATAKIMSKTDIGFFDKQDRLVVYLAPLSRWPGKPRTRIKDSFLDWNEHMDKGEQGGRENLKRFIQDVLAITPNRSHL